MSRTYLPLLPKVLLIAALSSLSLSGFASAASAPFGSKTPGDGALVGIFYDLKQTQSRKPVPDADKNYLEVIDRFIADSVNESYLNDYFRAGLPLYATQIYMPKMNADKAPAAFSVEKLVEPTRWLIHYKGQISPPKDGTYRFIGGADAFMIVLINQEVVLVGKHDGIPMPSINWTPVQAGYRPPAIDPYAAFGKWIDLKADDPVDIDIIIGERIGGAFSACLVYEKQGNNWPKKDGRLIKYPLFQLAPQHVNTKHIFTTDTPWKIYP